MCTTNISSRERWHFPILLSLSLANWQCADHIYLIYIRHEVRTVHSPRTSQPSTRKSRLSTKPSMSSAGEGFYTNVDGTKGVSKCSNEIVLGILWDSLWFQEDISPFVYLFNSDQESFPRLFPLSYRREVSTRKFASFGDIVPVRAIIRCQDW